MSQAPSTGRRRAAHRRSISCDCFVRDDGGIELEGLLVDTKPEPLVLVNRVVAAGAPIHQMRLRLTVDTDQRIVAAQASSEQHPYPTCAEVEAGYARLVGLRIERGFTREVKRLLHGVEGCTHLTELLPTMATTYFQVLWANAAAARGQDSTAATPLGGCHALRPDGVIVKTYFPHFIGRDSA